MFTLWSKLLSMGARCSSMFQRQRDEDVPDRNGGGSHQDTDLEGVINENVEIEERNDRTPDSDQLENEGKRQDTGEAQAQKDGPPDAPKRGKKRGATTATNARKRTKRAQNWKPDETLKLIELRMQPPLDTGKSEWEAISVQIPERTAKQCQQRWDTVVKPYKKIKRHCDANGKAIGQVTEEELRSMNVDWRCWRDNHKWYNLIHEYYLRLSSGHPSHVLNVVAASTGISSGGNSALSSGVAATSFPVEEREPSPSPVTEGAAVCFLHNPLEWMLLSQIFICYLVHVPEIVVASVLTCYMR
ncbi:hypothetical protein KC19_8G016500 [Ceratodon purpureus]|uniref:Myb-like domain-containing protein n=1 Tax=Ceratodon purpureus TaxID=3225 RepID=A0A8T0GYD8_CERPU|nr:hypothetical protein KC19_N046400 [Ceratodon purpureus]KAG0563259.1 hypothetical protein KC19_8G016500 [Ceratodon purpureus]